VVRAYAQLQQEHVVYAIPQSGYFLVEKKATGTADSPGVINFASGAPDEQIFPYDEFRHCLNQAIDLYQQNLFNYVDAQGLPELLSVLAEHLADYQVFAKEENIFVTAGSQQALQILCDMDFPREKSVVLVEQPAYTGLLKLLELKRIPAMGIERGFSGLDLHALEALFARGNVKFFYTTPRLQHPLGTSLSLAEKRQMVKMAEKYDVYIVEDDYLADLAMQGSECPLYYEDVAERVIYLKSFSKTLLPGLRVAAAVVPPVLRERFAAHKKWLDLGTSVVSQGALAIYIKSGMLQAHRKKLKNIYAEKMRRLQRAVRAADTSLSRWHVPVTGFFACAACTAAIDGDQVIAALAAKGVRLHSIQDNYLAGYPAANVLKFSVSKTDLASIDYGMELVLLELAAQRKKENS